MTLIDKLNRILQKAIDYTQEGLRQEGFHVDFQNAQNPNPPMQTGYQPPQAYPMHPNLDEEQRRQYQQQQQPKVEIQVDDKKQQNNSQTFIDINTDK